MRIFCFHYWRLLPLLPMLVALLSYFPATEFGYVWDDRGLLLQSPNLRSWDLIWSAIGQAFLNYQVYFRPLPLLSLGLEQLISGGSPFVAHLIAIVFFSVNCALLAVLAAVIAVQRGIEPRLALTTGMGAALLYALHPALIESVAWISCRFDLMLTFFCLLMLLADRLISGPLLRAATVAVLFFLAALCKEMAMGAALALPLLHLLLAPSVVRGAALPRYALIQGHIHVYAGLLFSGTIYLGLRYWRLNDLYAPALINFEVISVQHLLVVLKSIGAYLRYAAWPFTGLSPLHTLQLPLSPLDSLVLLGGTFTVASALLLVAALRGYRGAAGFLLPYSAALMPVINLFPLQIGDNYMHERFLNFPLAFFCMGAALGALAITTAASRFSRQFRVLCVGLALLYWMALSVINLRASLPFWKDNVSLWTLAVMREPDSWMAQTNLQAAYIGAGLNEEAVRFTEGLLKNQHGELRFQQVEQYLLALAALGKPTKHLIPMMLERLRAVEPAQGAKEFATIYANLARLYMLEGLVMEAQELYEEALRLVPLHSGANYGMAICYMALGRQDLAQPYYELWLKYAHPSSIPHLKADMANVVRRIKKAQAALPQAQ